MVDNTYANAAIAEMIPGKRTSPVELLHPDGVALDAIVIGAGCPDLLRPGTASADSGCADLVVLAPDATEYRSLAWLDRSAAKAVEALDADGIIYIVAPAGVRWRLMRLLQKAQMTQVLALAHLPEWAPPRHLIMIPLEPLIVQYARQNLISEKSLRWRGISSLLNYMPGRSRLSHMLPAVGLVMQRAGARLPFEWLFQLDTKNQSVGTAIISSRWYGSDGTAVLHRFAAHEAVPSLFVKMAMSSSMVETRKDEGEVLARLAASARNAGANIPETVLRRAGNHSPALLQQPVGGRSLAVALSANPHLLDVCLERVATWLAQWNISTRTVGVLDAATLEKELIIPARLLAPFLQHGEEYVAWLKAMSRHQIGKPVPFVAAHHDLTAWNILLDETGTLGIIDWEDACERDLPLLDLYYFVVDAIAAKDGYIDRERAFRECFDADGTHNSTMARLQHALESKLDIVPMFSEVAFHVCWLRHAANEQRKKPANAPRPFRGILQSVVLQSVIKRPEEVIHE